MDIGGRNVASKRQKSLYGACGESGENIYQTDILDKQNDVFAGNTENIYVAIINKKIYYIRVQDHKPCANNLIWRSSSCYERLRRNL